MPTALPPSAAYQQAHEARQRAGGGLAYYAKMFQRRELADEKRALVEAAGLFWSVTGELTTPAIGRTPAFIASDIRLVHDDGSVSDAMLDHLHADFVAHLEQQAAEDIAESRRAA
ncbi:hypothetical protein [Cupriavidus sp. Marseille-Q8015]